MNMVCPHCNHLTAVRVTSTGKLSIGSVGWWYGSRLLTEELLYLGERPQDTKERAIRTLEMLNREALTYMHHATAKVYPL